MAHSAFRRTKVATTESKTFKYSLRYDNEPCRPVIMTENSFSENRLKIPVMSSYVEQASIYEINTHFKGFVNSVKPFSKFQTDTRSYDLAARIDYSSRKLFYAL